MTNPAEDYDPLADAEKAPALSFKNAAVGTVQTIDVVEPCKLVQQRDFDTDEPATWPDGNPKMAAVFNGTDAHGDKVSLWCPKPSSMFSAVADAQKALGRRIAGGDTVDRIHVKFEKEEPPKSAKHSPRKIYKAKVEPLGPKVAEAPAADPFGDDDQPPF
ncbi:MAG TPA: hypothetical protein VFL65_00725 [Jatrophihabitans sp.]|nr:hypothetical protein [Jatrophihabitans sp.]